MGQPETGVAAVPITEHGLYPGKKSQRQDAAQASTVQRENSLWSVVGEMFVTC